MVIPGYVNQLLTPLYLQLYPPAGNGLALGGRASLYVGVLGLVELRGHEGGWRGEERGLGEFRRVNSAKRFNSGIVSTLANDVIILLSI